jgi:hypothetical protein
MVYWIYNEVTTIYSAVQLILFLLTLLIFFDTKICIFPQGLKLAKRATPII